MNRVKTLGVVFLSLLVLPLTTVFAQEEYQQEPLEDPTLYYQQTVTDDIYEQYDTVNSYTDDIPRERSVAAITTGFLATAFAGGLILVWLGIALASYIYSAIALMKIGKDLDYKNSWYSWIPILNIVMLFNLGNQNPWLILLLLIPGLGTLIIGILTIIALADIAEKRGYDKVLALISLIPFGAYVLLYLLAWKPKN
jgi:hypothetical protein